MGRILNAVKEVQDNGAAKNLITAHLRRDAEPEQIRKGCAGNFLLVSRAAEQDILMQVQRSLLILRHPEVIVQIVHKIVLIHVFIHSYTS